MRSNDKIYFNSNAFLISNNFSFIACIKNIKHTLQMHKQFLTLAQTCIETLNINWGDRINAKAQKPKLNITNIMR